MERACVSDLLFQHLRRHGVDLHQTIAQTDNGAGFTGGPQAKRTTAFTRLIEERYGRGARSPQ